MTLYTCQYYFHWVYRSSQQVIQEEDVHVLNATKLWLIKRFLITELICSCHMGWIVETGEDSHVNDLRAFMLSGPELVMWGLNLPDSACDHSTTIAVTSAKTNAVLLWFLTFWLAMISPVPQENLICQPLAMSRSVCSHNCTFGYLSPPAMHHHRHTTPPPLDCLLTSTFSLC